MTSKFLLYIFLCIPITSWSTEKLIMLTWSGYIDPSIVAEFEQQYDAEVIFEFYESTEDLAKRLTQAGSNLHDVVVIDGSDIDHYVNLEWLEKLNEDEIKTIVNLDDKLLTLFDKPDNYGVPYFWGTLGIAYREDMVSPAPTSWQDIFQPDPKIGKHIGMIKDGRDIFGMGLKSLGYSANTMNFDAILEVEDLILSQAQSVYTYRYSELTEEAHLVKGNVSICVLYNGDALTLQQFEPSIKFFVPPEGGNLWVDYLTILSKAPNKNLAKKFISFLNKPKIAARNAEFLYFATPNKEAMKHTSDSYKNNSIIFPSDKVLKNSEIYKDLPPRILRKINNITASLPER